MHNCERQRRPRPSRVITPLMAMMVAGLAAACGSTQPAEQPAPSAAAPAAAPAATEGHDMAAMAAGKVFFVEPKDGASVKSPVHFEFGAEGVTISPVPEGTVEHAREGMGHHHLGVEQDCLPPGQAIPKGTPGWVHFGKGDKTIDMQLTPGTHKFSLAAGDDLHTTIPGLCQTITITVTP